MKRILCGMALAAGILAATHARAGEGEVKKGVYTHAKLGIRFQAPVQAYEIELDPEKFRLHFYGDGRLAEIRSRDGKVSGALSYWACSMKAGDYAAWRAKTVREIEGVTEFQILSEKTLDRKPGAWILQETRNLYKGAEERYVRLYVADGRKDFELVLRVDGAQWEEYRAELLEILESFEFVKQP
jgi:hypothetical protein